jgi:hypothetical protein
MNALLMCSAVEYYVVLSSSNYVYYQSSRDKYAFILRLDNSTSAVAF